MPRYMKKAAIVASTLAFVAACSKGTPSAAQAAPGGSHAAGTTVSTANPCDRKLLTPDDGAGILREPITGTKAIAGDPQSCKLTTSGFAAITVMVRPGVGQTTVSVWKEGKMPLQAAPLSGVGESAVWVEDLHEVVAEEHNVLCDIQLRATGPDLVGSTADLQKKVGALCNRIFAAIK